LATRWRIYLVIAMVGLSVIGMLGYGFYTDDCLFRVYAPSVDAAMETKLEAKLAHLWLTRSSAETAEKISQPFGPA
jgi:hypothetical protein